MVASIALALNIVAGADMHLYTELSVHLTVMSMCLSSIRQLCYHRCPLCHHIDKTQQAIAWIKPVLMS